MITTKDCVEYIVNYLIQKENNYTNIKDWKRLSKKGTGSNIIRKFQNKVTGREVEIRSSDTEIFEILKKDKTIGMFGLPVGTVVDFSKQTKPEPIQSKIKNFNDFKGKKYRFMITDYDGCLIGTKFMVPKYTIIVFPMNLNADDIEVYFNSPGVEPVMNHLGIDAESEDNTFDYFGDMNKAELKKYFISCGWKEDKKLMD